MKLLLKKFWYYRSSLPKLGIQNGRFSIILLYSECMLYRVDFPQLFLLEYQTMYACLYDVMSV